MELRQLVYLDAVVRYGGFTRAAKRLHVAQPAVSAQVKRLEAELGVVLLHRTTRRLALTPAGELFLDRARRALAQLDAARGEIAQVSSVLNGTVRMGATQVLGTLDLPAVLARFRRRYAGVRIELRTGLLAELVAQVDAGALDIVIGPAHPELTPKYGVALLAEETLVLAVPPSHRLAGADRGVRLTEVRDDPFICLPPGSGLHAILMAATSDEGFEPQVDFQTHGPASIRELVAAGLGVALLAGSVARGPGPPLETLALERPISHPPIAVITPADRSPSAAASEFVTCLRSVADAEG